MVMEDMATTAMAMDITRGQQRLSQAMAMVMLMDMVDMEDMEDMATAEDMDITRCILKSAEDYNSSMQNL